MVETELLSWSDNAEAIDEIIARCRRTLDVVDEDLSLQGWETLSRADELRRALHERRVQVRLILNSTATVASRQPRLMQLLSTHGHALTVLQTRSHPKPARFMAVADGQHCILRPVLVQSHGFAYFNNPAKSNIYATELKVIWDQGGRRLFPEAFGL